MKKAAKRSIQPGDLIEMTNLDHLDMVISYNDDTITVLSSSGKIIEYAVDAVTWVLAAWENMWKTAGPSPCSRSRHVFVTSSV